MSDDAIERYARSIKASGATVRPVEPVQAVDDGGAIARYAQSIKAQEDRGRANLYAAGDATPDDAAKANRLAIETGIPADVVERELGMVEQQAQQRRNMALANRYPAIGKFTANPRDAAVSRDDVDGLAKVSRTFREREMLPQFRMAPRVRLPSDRELDAATQGGYLVTPIGQEDAYASAIGVRAVREQVARDEAESFSGNIAALPGQAGRAVGAGGVDILSGTSGVLRAASELSAQFSLGSIIQRQLFGRSVDDVLAANFAAQQGYGKGLAKDVAGDPNRNRFLRDVVSGFRSTPQTAVALGLSAAGLPSVGAAFVGGTVAGDAYGTARAKGLDPIQSAIYGGTQGFIEFATERVPAMKFLADTKAGASFGRKLFNNLAAEMPQEQAATVLQDLNDWVVLNPEKSFSQYLAERPDAALSTAIATAVGSTTVVTTGQAVSSLASGVAKVAQRGEQARQAETDARFLDDLSKGVVDNKVRKRDPSAFARFLEISAEGTPVEKLYIPGDQVASYFQSNDMDWHDTESGWSWDETLPAQIDEALATGGDVVVRTSDFAAHVAGTPAWDALKDHLRTSAGGMSLSDAQAYAKDEAASLKALGQQFGEQSMADDPRQRLYWSVRDKLTAAGFTQSAADANAAVVTGRYAARAARMGQELTGTEFDTTDVQQVLPAGLAPIVAADQLDLAIATMKRQRDQRTAGQKFGPSLVEWISARGGVEDKGGDIAALGGATWHKGKVGKKRLIRPASEGPALPGMGGGIGASTGFGLDDLALRAWEAGYLQGEERPTPNDLLDAIGAELGGQPRYAEDRTGQTDAMREAADQLYEIVDRQGIDPIKATGAEIREAVARYQLKQSEGRGFDQTIPRSMAEVDALADDLGVSIGYAEDATTIKIGKIVAGERGKGAGSRIMDALAGYADSAGKRITLTPSTDFGGSSVKRLTAFYKRFGFVENKGRNKDFSTRDAMYRDPVAGRSYNQSPVESDAFKAWFGDSKVVDENGKPLVVYHGTAADFAEFSNSADTKHIDLPGFYFTPDPSIAERFSESASRREFRDDDGYIAGYEGAAIVPAYLSIQNPVEIVLDDAETGRMSKASDVRAMLVAAQKAGHDGAIIRGWTDGSGETQFVTFEPTQIKSVNNRGTFDPADPRILHQSFDDGPRGRITFAGGRNIIDLFQSRNLSTFLHESGHLWLEELRADAETDGAPDGVKADWQAVQDWFKANGHPIVDGVIPVEAHELWARGWERYAMEGKSPSSSLRRAFDQFRSWLLSIYQVVNNLRAPITPEIRAVMDRLIATDEEIASAAEDQNIMALFTSAQQARMTEAEFEDYQASVAAARDEAHDALLFKTMEIIRRSRTKAFKDEEAGVRDDVTVSVNRRPEFRALHLLRTGKMLDDPEAPAVRVKLDRAWLIETYGADALSMLPKGIPIYADKDVTHADIVAEMVGFQSGDELVRTLMAVEERTRQLRAAGDKRSARVAIIDQETAAIMTERHGDPLTDGSIEEEALAAIHNDRQGEVIAAEMRALSRKTGDTPTPYRLARQWAARTIAQSQVADAVSGSAIQRYARAAAKAAKAAEQAMLKGDAAETFRQKQSQMLNNALIAEAKVAKDRVDVAVSRLGKLARRATIKSIDQDYLDQVHGLLEQVEFRQRSQRDIERQESFEEWAQAQEAAGYDVVVPPSFAAVLGQRNWSRLTIEELTGLDDTIKQIVHLGRLKQKLLDGQDEREFNAVVDEVEIAAAQLPPRPPKGGFTDPTWWDSIKGGVAAMDAALLKMETVFDWLDGGNPDGVFNRTVFRPITEAQHRQAEMTADYVGRLTDLLKVIPKAQLSRWMDRVTVPELIDPATGEPMITTRDRLISMALNMGNEGNARKLAGGYGWNEAAVMAVLDRELTAEDWTYVQAVWDTIDGLWPEAQAMEKRLNGVAPDKIEARVVQTRHGPFRGGYFPVVYDPAKDYDTAAQAAKSADLFESSYVRASTRSGSLNERTKVERPIYLSLGVINRHVVEVIHDITHREAVMAAWRLLSDKRVMRAVDETLGPEIQQQFKPWLQHIANEFAAERAGLAGWEKLVKGLRTNATMVGMAYRASTVIMQIAGYSNSIEVIGEKWFAIGAAETVKNPISAFNYVLEHSAEVRGRMDTLDRDIRDGIRQTLGDPSVGAAVKRYAFYGVGYMDRMVVVPTWLGAYNKELASGATEADAIYAADKAVRKSQGSGAAKDLASVQRGGGRAGEAMKLLTMFYSYMSAFYQRQRTFGRDVGSAVREGRVSDFPRLLARAWWLFAVPAVLSELLAGRGPDDDDDYAAWVAQRMLLQSVGPIPFLRDVAGPVTDKLLGNPSFGYKFTPAQGAFDSALRTVGDIGNIVEGDDTTRMTRNVLETTGYVTGMVPGQVAASTQFIVDVGYGEQDPQTLGDWVEGLAKGKIKQE